MYRPIYSYLPTYLSAYTLSSAIWQVHENGTFSSGEVGEYCENCHNCLHGEDKIKDCTREKDTVCECPYGKYITSFSTCVPCDECNEKDCKIVCNTTTPKSTATPLKQSTTPARTIVMTTPSQKTTTSTSIPPTTNNQEEGSSWKDIYLVPIISSSVFVIFVIGGLCICARRSLCCWTRESREFWRNYCPWCCKTTGIEGGNEGIAVSQGNKKSTMCNILAGCCITVQQTGAGDNAGKQNESDNVERNKKTTATANIQLKHVKIKGSSVHIHGTSATGNDNVQNTTTPAQGAGDCVSTDSVFEEENDKTEGTDNPEKKPLMNPNGSSVKQTNGSSRKGKRSLMSQRLSISSLPDLPEDGPLSLPSWCYQDNARVQKEHILNIAPHIGKEVTRMGLKLNFTNGEMETIEHKHDSDLLKQNLVVLQQWVEKTGVHAKKGVLAQALDDVGKAEFAMKHLWSDQEWKQGMSKITKKPTFWGRRKSQELEVKLDSGYFRGKDWTKQSTWQGIWDIMLENDYGSFRQLKLACGTVELQQPRLDGVQRCPYFNPSSHSLDQDSVPRMNSQCENRKPVSVPHGVNCLFSAASIIYSGSEDHFLELKLRTVIELTYHKDYYLNQETLIHCIKAEYALSPEENIKLTKPKHIEAHFESLVRKTLGNQSDFSLLGNSIHLFGLASVLNCNIQSIYPTMRASQQSPLNVLITPRKKEIEDPTTVFIMWSRHTPLPEDGQFVPNHFVPLLQIPTTH
ncbi:uncharacterized protein [Antedon mediterranea]|uniref:uncharacterized protein n=1 Tax=Antedon mediterranea TaxID=105859 RepID=UPI003AF53A72